MQNTDLGFQKEQMLVLPVQEQIGPQFDVVKNRLLEDANILEVTAGSGMPGGPIGNEWGQISWPGKDQNTVIPMNHLAVDCNFPEVFGMEIVKGRTFSQMISADTLNFILNEAAVKATGMEDPLGTEFTLLRRTGSIIGIVKDFHVRSLQNEIGPVILRMLPQRFWRFMFIRVEPNSSSWAEILDRIESVYTEFAPEYPFTYEFLDDRIDRQYRNEQRVGDILTVFTLLTVIIAGLGLLGMASFIAEQRTKEIGIRKVLGASMIQIIGLLTREFGKWVLLANCIAWPIAYLIMNRYLDNFAYRIRIRLDIMITAGSAALLIAVIAVSVQAWRAASTNPVRSLKYE